MNTKERTEQKEISVCFRSCDTEDWSNDAENTALITEINYILQFIITESSYFKF